MGKSIYTVNYTCSQNELVTVINQWLQANGFRLEYTDGYNWFHAVNEFTYGHRGFEYRIVDNHTVEFYAFVGKLQHADSLDGAVGVIPKQAYIGIIQQLVDTISSPFNSAMPRPNTFQQAVDDRNEKMALGALIGSIISVVLALFGYAFGIVIIAGIYYLAAAGLKSSKKGLAIAAIIITSIALLIIILGYIVMFTSI